MSDSEGYMNGKDPFQHGTTSLLIPKEEKLEDDMQCHAAYSQQNYENVASTSGSNAMSLLIDMGFSRSLIQKAIHEKGEDDIELLMETLLLYSNSWRPDFQSPGSSNAMHSQTMQPKLEPDTDNCFMTNKRASLLSMKFPPNLIEFALDKLGKDVPIDEAIDFITAAQLAETLNGEELEGSFDDAEYHMGQKNDASGGILEKTELTNEVLFETMDKTIDLLKKGFSDQEISMAVDKLGRKVQISELGDTIFTEDCSEGEKSSLRVFKKKHIDNATTHGNRGAMGREDLDHSSHNCSTSMGYEDASPNNLCWQTGKRLKEEEGEVYKGSNSMLNNRDKDECIREKRQKRGDTDSFSLFDQAWLEEELETNKPETIVPCALGSRLFKTLDKNIAEQPYIFFGNCSPLSPELWLKVSNFLYSIPPEFVNTGSFSALSRNDGYIHNLPTSNRFHIIAKPLMTIQEAIPQTKKYWPNWDSRSLLSSFSSDSNEALELCRRLEKVLVDSGGLLSLDQKRCILRHCYVSNLLWFGPCKLGPVEPEHLERILGYPANHTKATHISLTERMKMLDNCFQVETIGYQLSVLKALFPGGMTVLSFNSGIGGALIALARLGIHLKGVVSVESSETKRWVFNRWWKNSGQTGELLEVDNIQKLTSKKLQSLMEKFGGFDLVVCQNRCNENDSSRHGKSHQSFDFALFYEFVRVVQRVRSMTGRS